MALRLPEQMKELLREVLVKHRPNMVGILDSPDDIRLTEEERFDIRQAVTDEFCSTGLREDSEPNRRGLLLENMIDVLEKL